MDIPSSYSEKYRPRPRKTGEPRNQREELIQQFLDRLNEEQARDGRKPYTFGRLAKKLEGISDSTLYQLFTACNDASVRSFGAMMTYKVRRSLK